MSNFVNKTKGWQSVNREIIFDNTLSDRARFLYVYMACKPDGWDFYRNVICKEIGINNHTLSNYLNELIEAGVLERVGQQVEAGRFSATKYILNDNPVKKKNACEKTACEKTAHEKLTHKEIYNNRDIDNKDIDSKKEIINKFITKKVENSPEEHSLAEFKKRFNEQGNKMLKDEVLNYNLARYKITNMPALIKSFGEYIVQNLRTTEFMNNSYAQNCMYLQRIISKLNLSEATGVKLGVDEYLRDGHRYYTNPRGKEVEVPMDAPPRRSGDTIWDAQNGNWCPDI